MGIFIRINTHTLPIRWTDGQSTIFSDALLLWSDGLPLAGDLGELGFYLIFDCLG
jgi:hypothetical protein